MSQHMYQGTAIPNLLCDQVGKAEGSDIDLSGEGCLRDSILTGCNSDRTPRPALFAGLHFNRRPPRFGMQRNGLLQHDVCPGRTPEMRQGRNLPQVSLRLEIHGAVSGFLIALSSGPMRPRWTAPPAPRYLLRVCVGGPS